MYRLFFVLLAIFNTSPTHIGILKPVVNAENKYKYYDEFDFLQLANARILRSLGLPLPEVLEYNNSSVVHQKEILSEKSRQVRAQIEKLQELELRLHLNDLSFALRILRN